MCIWWFNIGGVFHPILYGLSNAWHFDTPHISMYKNERSSKYQGFQFIATAEFHARVISVLSVLSHIIDQDYWP